MEKRQRHIEVLRDTNRALIERMNKLMLRGRKSLSLGTTCFAFCVYSLCSCEMFGTFHLFLIALLTSCHGSLILSFAWLTGDGKFMYFGVMTVLLRHIKEILKLACLFYVISTWVIYRKIAMIWLAI